MVWTSGNGPKCPVSPEDQGEDAKPYAGLVQCPKCLWWSAQIEFHLCPEPSPDVRAAVIEECAKVAASFGVGKQRSSYGGSDIAQAIRALALSRPDGK